MKNLKIHGINNGVLIKEIYYTHKGVNFPVEIKSKLEKKVGQPWRLYSLCEGMREIKRDFYTFDDLEYILHPIKKSGFKLCGN